MVARLRSRSLETPSVGRLAAASFVDGQVLLAAGTGLLRLAGVRYDDGLRPVDESEPMPKDGRELRRRIEEQRVRPAGWVRTSGDPIPNRSALEAMAGAGTVLAMVGSEVGTGGATPGRELVGVRLMSAAGRRAAPIQLATRAAVPAVGSVVLRAVVLRRFRKRRTYMPALLAVWAGVLAAQLRDPRHRTCGDRLAGTRPVRIR